MKKVCINIILALMLFPSLAKAQSTLEKKRKNEIKVALLSLASGTSKVTYERWVREYRSVELTAGVIGWGFDKLKNSNPKGTAWRIAYKMIKPSETNQFNQLCGFYLKPELCFSSYEYNHLERGRLKVNYFALMGVLGYDWVKEWFVFDLYGGAGYAFGDNNFSNYHHGFICIRKDIPIALTAGFRIGVAF